MLFNRSAIVPSLAVSPNDARSAEAGTVYVTLAGGGRKKCTRSKRDDYEKNDECQCRALFRVHN